MNRKSFLILLWLVCLLLAACSPVPTSVSLQNTPVITPTPFSPTPTETPTSLPPMASVKEKANCYGGPDENEYPLVATFEKGEIMEIVGRDESAGYWIVLDTKSGKGCWVKSQFVQIQGTVEPLPILIPAPTVAARPSAPGNLEAASLCQKDHGVHFSVILKWEDKSNNETGFVIYRNGKKLVTLDANTTQYEVETLVGGNQLSIRSDYEVFAFNNMGNSTRVQISFIGHCP